MIGQRIPLEAGLWLVGVPIGTARDITLRALDVLTSADHLACEDTRNLRKLLDIHGIALNGRRIYSLHDHSGDRAVQGLVAAMTQGQSVAYASDAGMPLIADPGFELVRAAQEEGVKVTAAPGPSAVTTALALAGLGTDAFHFAGFLPPTQSARIDALKTLRDIPATLIFFETAKRLPAVLRDMSEMFGPDRPASLCRELTKRFEEVIRAPLSALTEQAVTTGFRGECVLLVDRPRTERATETDIKAQLETALEHMSLKDAAKFVADATGAKKRDVYQIAINLKR